ATAPAAASLSARRKGPSRPVWWSVPARSPTTTPWAAPVKVAARLARAWVVAFTTLASSPSMSSPTSQETTPPPATTTSSHNGSHRHGNLRLRAVGQNSRPPISHEPETQAREDVNPRLRFGLVWFCPAALRRCGVLAEGGAQVHAGPAQQRLDGLGGQPHHPG